jgi:hypothetical protein
LVNSLEKTGARDTVERFSLAVEKLGPIMAAVLMVPSSLVLAALATAGGYALARGDHASFLFESARYILFGVPIFTVVGPLMLPAGDRTNPVRMLLLPISRTTLYVAQSAAAFGDVWVLLMLPVVFCVPLGLAAGGAIGVALFALLSGVMLVLVIIGISSLATSVLHLVVRDRRRGELLALAVVLLIPLASVLPGLLGGDLGERSQRTRTVPGFVMAAGNLIFRLYPSELYVGSIRAAARHRPVLASGSAAALGATAAVLHVLAVFAFARMLDSPGSSGGRRVATLRSTWGRTLPGLSAGASAVALAQLRLALRTPRGRSILLSPLIMLVIVGFVLNREADGMTIGGFNLLTGLGVASFTSFISLMSILPIAMNQFAVDNAGVTLALLSPLTDREYLTGKAVGNALIVAPPALFCVVASLVAFPGGAAALWVAIPIALLSTYLLVAPAAAIFSAIFPRAVDLNSIGGGSNAHGLSGLLGLVAFVAAGVPCLAIVLGALRFGRPFLAPVLLLAWCGISYAISQVLFVAARRIFANRRENLATMR